MNNISVKNGYTETPYRVASVVLNFNSDKDLFQLLPQLVRQKDIDHSLIIVDNGSSRDCISRIKNWLDENYAHTIVGSYKEILNRLQCNEAQTEFNDNIYFVLNKENRGYSAGNNVGMRIANVIGACAILIANPDMRITDEKYLSTLVSHMMQDPSVLVTASRVLGINGENQNPLLEASYLQELLWPLMTLYNRIKDVNGYVMEVKSNDDIFVSKVTGCCMLIRMSFAKEINYLDENVFLYCEEAILSSQVRRKKGKILYVPSVNAIHEHIASEKTRNLWRVNTFIKSRIYYLKNYSGYSSMQVYIMSLSYALYISMITIFKLINFLFKK